MMMLFDHYDKNLADMTACLIETNLLNLMSMLLAQLGTWSNMYLAHLNDELLNTYQHGILNHVYFVFYVM